MERDELSDKPDQTTRPRPASRQEMLLRVGLVRKLIQEGKYPSEIKRAMSKEFGIRPRVIEKYIAKAREQIRRDLGKTRIELQCEALEFYRGIVADQKQPVQARLRAREQMDRMLGLHAGFQLHVTTDSPASVDSSKEDRLQLFEAPDYLEFLRQQAAKEDAEAEHGDSDTEQDQGDGDPGTVWEDGDTGTDEPSAVA